RSNLEHTIDLAPLGLGNLALSFDKVSGGAEIRVQPGLTVSDVANVLCTLAATAGVSNPALACTLFKALLPTALTNAIGEQVTGNGVPAIGSAAAPPAADAPPAAGGTNPIAGIDTSIISQVQKILGGLS